MACIFCNKVLEAFKTIDQNGVGIRFGLLNDILKLDCERCKEFRHYLDVTAKEEIEMNRWSSSESDFDSDFGGSAGSYSSEYETPKYEPESCVVSMQRSSQYNQTAFLFSVSYDHDDSAFGTSEFGLVRSHSAPWGYLKDLEPSWINPSIFSSWKRKCDSEHRSCQTLPVHKLPSFPPARPRYLVDVENFCLVPTSASPDRKYVALSYVWGRVMSLQTLLTNVEKLQIHNSLLAEEYASQIPNTIKDAIYVTKQLEERFLWVDSLCIVQDDETTKTEYLNNMASIYAYATVTIIAAQGTNANSGIRGIKRDATSQPRTSPIRSWTIGEEQIRFFINRERDGAWYDRAWTFQEGKFAGRRIFFEYGSALWSCSLCEWYEEIHFNEAGENKRNVLFKSDQQLFVLPFPNLDGWHGYESLVKDFYRRQLTFEGDSLFAFAGITGALSQTFHGGFLCGFPELFFDSALLWTWIGSPKRRILASNSVGIPSWSWAGWFKLENCPGVNNWDASQDYLKCSGNNNYFAVKGNDTFPEYQIYPILQWYSSNTISTEGRRPVTNRGYEHRDSALNLELPLPSGWARHEYKPDTASNEKGFEKAKTRPLSIGQWKYYYTHESDPLTHFWYPIPISSQEEKTRVIIPPIHRYLLCRTQTATIRKSERTEPRSSTEWTYTALYDDLDAFIGGLHVHEREYGVVEGQEFDLIAISRGVRNAKSKSGPPGWYDIDRKHPRRNYPNRLCEYFNVLWIEWDDKHEIAHRKGVGHVVKEAWEKLDLKWVDVILD